MNRKQILFDFDKERRESMVQTCIEMIFHTDHTCSENEVKFCLQYCKALQFTLIILIIQRMILKIKERKSTSRGGTSETGMIKSLKY